MVTACLSVGMIYMCIGDKEIKGFVRMESGERRMVESGKYPKRIKIAPASDVRQFVWVTVHSDAEVARIQRMRYEILEEREGE